MTTLSASIMAHPSRAAFVDELREQLDRDVPVSWDVDSPPSPDKQRRWAVGVAAWEMAEAEWHIVLQDDVTVCRDLLAGLELALAHVPDDIGIVQPYVGQKRPLAHQFTRLSEQAKRGHASWIQHRSMQWGVAVCVRTATIGDMIEWASLRRTFAYDTRVGRYYRDVLGQDTWYTWPSLVDHRDGPSLVGHGTGRTAKEPFTGSALDLDWGGPVVRDRLEIKPRRTVGRAKMRPIVRG